MLCLVTVLLLLLALGACVAAPADPTTVPTAAPTQAPTTEPIVAPTSPPAIVKPPEDPTEPIAPDTSWQTAAPKNAPYEEYFSEVRIFSYIAGPYTNIWKVNGDRTPGAVYNGNSAGNAYCLQLDQQGLHITSYNTKKTLWTVPRSETLTGIDCYTTDGHYAYCVRNQNEIFRVDLLTGETETLANDITIPVNSTYCLSLHDQEVLLFLTQTGDRIAVNRLYLPTMTQEMLYDGIGGNGFPYYFDLSYCDTDALIWYIFDPAFIPRVADILSDPDSDYKKYAVDPNGLWNADSPKEMASHPDFIKIVHLIEIHEETPSLLDCYLDIPNGTYEQSPSYWCPDMQEPRGPHDVSFWAQLYMRFSDPEAEPVTDAELAEAFDRSPFSFIRTLSEDGPWNESREEILRQLIAAKRNDADAFIAVLEAELVYYRTAAAKAQPVCQLTQQILDQFLHLTSNP